MTDDRKREMEAAAKSFLEDEHTDYFADNHYDEPMRCMQHGFIEGFKAADSTRSPSPEAGDDKETMSRFLHEQRMNAAERSHLAKVKEIEAEVERLRSSASQFESTLKETMKARDAANEKLGKLEALRSQSDDVAELVSVLEAVRSQMCWERDRDQLTMGMADLHDSVTKALSRFRKEQS